MSLPEPHGGSGLIDLLVDESRANDLKSASLDWPSWDLTERQLCDFELLVNGAFSPLDGFMTRADVDGVRSQMRLADGTLWPMPITLDVPEEVAHKLEVGTPLALRDQEGLMLGVLHVEEVWLADRPGEAQDVFGTTSVDHPGVRHLLNETYPYYVGGRVEAVRLPQHHDFAELRETPAQVRARFEELGWEKVVAFQTRNPMHRAHVELTRRAAEEVGGNLLIHPVVGMTKPGDVDHYTRVRVYRELVEGPISDAELSLLNLAMRMGGPREAVWHAIIRKNHGCSHFIVGRDHAGPGSDADGEPFYGPYDAQELLQTHAEEIGVEMVPFKLMVYVPAEDTYRPLDEIEEGTETASISGTELRDILATGGEIPEWFTYPEVAEELRRSYPPRLQQGVAIFFTGLSGAGKSTVANVLLVKLLERGGRRITFLDGDIVRKNLSSELGFSKEDRDTNIRRIGFVAGEVAKHGGTAICAAIAPYEATRQEARELVESSGGTFVCVHVATPLEVAEERDTKGLYAKARAGIIKDFTGIDDPYEEPVHPEVTLDTTDMTPEQSADQIIAYLDEHGYLARR